MRPRPLAALLCLLCAAGCGERDRGAGVIEGPRRDVVEDTSARSTDGSKRILFGDLHVHTTWSIDAFFYSLPFQGGEGGHPPADACDFARYCSALDFFSINDHAEGLIPERWEGTKESIRQCNALSGDPADPDLVAFVGWEWTQAGATPETHYGHKNVIFPGLEDDELPARPITSLPDGTTDRARALWLVRGVEGALDTLGLSNYADFLWLIRRIAGTPDCEAGVDTRELPADCRENATTPAVLFEKLAQWDLETLVIPHGLAWGEHAPPGTTLDHQLTREQHDPERQRLLEVFSGHGNGESFRKWGRLGRDASSDEVCPEPTPDHLPCCWQAGEIMRARCGDLPATECETRVQEARRLALAAGTAPRRVFPDASAEDWLDCDQCRDCFKPVFSLRPGQSAQYGLAISNPDESDADGAPLRFRFGFISSSDDHHGRPGTGYKQVERRRMTDAHGFASERTERLLRSYVIDRPDDPRRPQPVALERERGFRQLFGGERAASFLYPGGLVAVHAAGRDRGSIWQALHRRAVSGTSGPRILLWFDLLNGRAGPVPMGSEAVLEAAPRFEVRALGSFVQKPGCPEESRRGLSPERLAALCVGECHHPSDERHRIAAIEVVRVRPQRVAGDAVGPLIEDPWRRFECPPDRGGCRVVFEDEEYPASERDAVYYVRAIQEETPAINAANLRTVFDAAGAAVSSAPCFGSYRTPRDDDCLAPAQERAWSSPIYVDRPRAEAGDPALSRTRDLRSAPSGS